MKLSNKIVLVTGGTSGIGLEAAKLFREEGATVIVIGQNPYPAAIGGKSAWRGRYLASRRREQGFHIERIVKQVSGKFGHIDVIFANAGMGLAHLWTASQKIRSTRNSM